MDNYITGIDPMSALVKSNSIQTNKVRTKEEVNQEFVAMFISQVMKDVFKAQSSMFGDDTTMGAFSEDMYNDIMMSKISSDIAATKLFGFDKMTKEIK